MSDQALTTPEDSTPTEIDLPDLEPRETVFVEHVIGGCSYSEAFRKAFGVKDLPSENALWRAASYRANKPAVKAHLEAARQAGIVRVNATLENQAQRFRQLSHLAEKKGELSTAVNAEDKIAKLFGLYHEDDAGREALAKVGAGLVGFVGSELAKQIAKAQGMTLDLTAETVPEATETDSSEPD